jgi:hypothetical protein
MMRIFNIMIVLILTWSGVSGFWFGHGTTVRFYLFTKENPVVGQCLSCTIQTSNFDSSRPTK